MCSCMCKFLLKFVRDQPMNMFSKLSTTSSYSKAGYTFIAKYAKMGTTCEKWKVYSGEFHATFFAFPISQHFAPGSAFAQKLKGFRGLFFRSINKTRNLPEMRKVYSECFAKTFAKYKIQKGYSQPNKVFEHFLVANELIFYSTMFSSH